MKKYYSSFFVSFISLVSLSFNENFPIGARSSALGNASISFTDMWSAHHNQAGLGFVKNISGGVYYENRFLVKELSVRGGCVVLPIKTGTFGLTITNFGYTQYNENKYSLSFAKTFGEKLSIGIAMDYLTTKIAEGYGNKGVLAGEVGIIAKPLKNLTIGAHVFNPTRTKIADYAEERVPTILRLGANYIFSDKVLVTLETEKDLSMKAVFKAGIEYKALNQFYLRAGLSTNPTISCFGFGLNLKNFKVDLSTTYHQVLGISPQLSLSYAIVNKTAPSTIE